MSGKNSEHVFFVPPPHAQQNEDALKSESSLAPQFFTFVFKYARQLSPDESLLNKNLSSQSGAGRGSGCGTTISYGILRVPLSK